MTALDIFTYSGQQVRTVIVDGEPWFVAADVTNALGLGNGRDAVSRLDADGVGNADIIDSMGRAQTARVLNEPGLYELIFQSRVAGAAEFKRWVTHEVLPAIRKTGAYVAPVSAEVQIANALILASQLLAEKDTRIAELEPAAAAWDQLASAEGDYEVADAAKILARAGVMTGSTRLFNQLAEMRWIFRGSHGKWKAYQNAVDAGYLAEKPMQHHHPRTGEVVLDPPQVRVTVRGLERLRVRLGSVDLEVAS